MAQILASRLRGANTVTDRGLRVGQLIDMIVDEATGKILTLVVRPTVKGPLGDLPKDEYGNVLIPYGCVVAIRDYVVVNEHMLVLQQAKAAEKTPPTVPELPI
ncbi:MAG: hypothetical protein APU95_00230 [Hadesarchaea archaeon YNP_N21]|nr:MAG: hypothetical protein APU95_00230 [Hadesarchaea archaeon YNP_N21]